MIVTTLLETKPWGTDYQNIGNFDKFFLRPNKLLILKKSKQSDTCT